jgi:4-amino-4-deoxy-L-arabinose transferase-like glycosyltransferase
MTRRNAYVLVALVSALPRLGVLLHERGAILGSFTEKSDRFAETFVHSGTYGFVAHVPSAYTQPLYGWFLIPVYWILGRNWAAVGLTQIALAVTTALLVLEIGRRFLSARAAVVAAVIATLNPYLVWHDIHVNREIVDQVLAAAIVLVTLVAADRRSWRLAALDGLLCGLAILGNTRLVFLPVLIAAYLLWRMRALVPAVAVLLLAGLAVTPWLVRNDVQVGCWTLTTDARALWKANNSNTYRVLASGLWLDEVPPLPGAPKLTAEDAANRYERTGKLVRVDECAQMDLYQHAVIQFWKHHPGEKTRLAGQAVSMLWDPRATETSVGPGAGTRLDTLRRWGEGAYMSVLYALALGGILLVPRAFAVLVVALLAYQTLAAAVFAGTTRYRAPWDFLVALLATATLAWAVERWRARTGRVQPVAE